MLGILFAGRNQIKELWVDSKVLRLADKLKRKCEKKWSRQRMQRMITKKKRERGELPPQRQQVERQGRGGSNIKRGGGPGRGRGGPGREGQQSGRGRNQQAQGRGRGGGGGQVRGRTEGKSQNRAGRGTSNPESSEAQSPNGKEGETQPAKGDVWFGHENHPGTKSFQRAVRKAYNAFPEDDFGPEIYKHVKKQLKGKRFFIDDGSGSCSEVSRMVIKNEMEKEFNSAKAAN